VALQVEQRLAAHVAEFRPFDRLEAVRVPLELLDVVERRGDVDRRDLVPVLAVGVDVVVVSSSASTGDTCGPPAPSACRAYRRQRGRNRASARRTASRAASV
jgi:hypothetical protein